MKNLSQIIFILFGILLSSFSGVEKEDGVTTSQGAICGTPKAVRLMAGKNIHAGSITVSNDEKNVYISYSSTGEWKIKATQLFIGACTAIPKGKTGNPNVGLFPHKEQFPTFTDSWKVSIPVSSLSSCFCIAAHAELVKVSNGIVVQSETGWGEAVQISPKGSWAMSFEYCIQACTSAKVNDKVEDLEGCSMSQGYWFSKPGIVWPGTVTIAGHTYTQEEGKAIWGASNTGGIPDSKAGFCQVVAIKLSGATVKQTASVWADVMLVERYLRTLGKLSPGNLPTGNEEAKAAAGRIGDWINSHHCP
jgi:hypothetical protein